MAVYEIGKVCYSSISMEPRNLHEGNDFFTNICHDTYRPSYDLLPGLSWTDYFSRVQMEVHGMSLEANSSPKVISLRQSQKSMERRKAVRTFWFNFDRRKFYSNNIWTFNCAKASAATSDTHKNILFFLFDFPSHFETELSRWRSSVKWSVPLRKQIEEIPVNIIQGANEKARKTLIF